MVRMQTVRSPFMQRLPAKQDAEEESPKITELKQATWESFECQHTFSENSRVPACEQLSHISQNFPPAPQLCRARDFPCHPCVDAVIWRHRAWVRYRASSSAIRLTLWWTYEVLSALQDIEIDFQTRALWHKEFYLTLKVGNLAQYNIWDWSLRLIQPYIYICINKYKTDRFLLVLLNKFIFVLPGKYLYKASHCFSHYHLLKQRRRTGWLFFSL